MDWEWKAKRLSQQWNDLKSILEKHLTNEIHPYVKLWKEFGITPGELEESGKMLGKDLGLGPTKRKTPLKRIVEQIDDAPEQ